MTAITTLTLNPTVDHSAKIDDVVPDRKLRCHDERYDPGGGGINVATAITQLGGEALALFTCGGAIGQLLRELLDQRSVRYDTILTDGHTRENVIIFESGGNQQFRFGMPGPRLDEEEQERCIQAVLRLDPAPQYLVLSGSLPPGVPADFYGRIIDRLGSSTRVILDVSGEALAKGVEQSVYLLKPNQRELEDLSGKVIRSDSDVRAAAHSMIDRGKVEVVMVSLGRGGVMLVTRDEEYRISAPSVKMRSKIGAGDSTVAGTVLALHRGMPLKDAARFGVACGM